MFAASLLLLAMAGCGGQDGEEPLLPGGVSMKNPLVTDTAHQQVIIAAQVNGQFFTQASPHYGIGSVNGWLGDKFMFRSWADPVDFHDALIAIGLQPGNNLTAESPKTETVQGDLLDVEITWAGAARWYALSEVVQEAPNEARGWAIRFGGNRSAAAAQNTGCLTCFTSCYLGITSNAQYTLQDMDDGVSRFTLNEEILPPGVTQVAIRYKRQAGSS